MRTIALFVAVASFALGQTSPKQMDVDRIFSAFNTRTPGCAVGVSKGGKLELVAGYGMADLERGVAITPQTIFESGSLAKQFTAAALMLLEQRGKISLDDAIGKYLPELKGAPGQVTIRQVISHTSGLREWRPIATFGGRSEEDYVFRNSDLLEMAARQKALNFDAGTHYSYSNTGYNIATILIERALGDGTTFQAFTKSQIFAPLEMTQSRWRDNFRQLVTGRALAYRFTSDGTLEQDTPIGNIIGAGGLLTTVGDLLKWNENFVHARVGGASLVEAQQKPAVLRNGKEITYAAGLIVSKLDGIREVSHSGATGGYRTWLGRYPDSGVSVAVMCNSAQAVPTVLGRATARLWTGGKAETDQSPEGTVQPTNLEELAGTYRSLRNNQVVELVVQDQKLGFANGGRWKAMGAHEFGLGQARFRFAMGNPVKLQVTNPDGMEVMERVSMVVPTPAQLQEFVGEYASEETASKLLIRTGQNTGELLLRIGSGMPMTLRPTFQDGFRTGAGAVVFRRENGNVVGLSVGDARVWDLRFERIQ